MTDILKIENGVLIACTDKSVTSVVIPEGVRRIGRIAFLDCASLVSVEIPEGVRYIDERAFNRCSSLESVVLPSSVTEIGEYAFRTCKSLKSVVIKSSATKICEGAFEYCESITSVEFSGTVAQWKEVEGKEVNLLHYIPAMSVKCSDGEWQKPVIFVKDGIAVKCLYNKATSVEIPEDVTAIGKRAFSGCKSLSTVTLGDDFEKVPSEWFDSLNEANANYEIICTEDSLTYKAIKRSARLKAHVKTLALQNAKNKKIAQVNKAGADAVLSSLLAGKADSSFEILSNTKSSTVVLLKIAKNTGLFKLGTDSSKWLLKIKKVIEAFSDLSKSGADIFAVIQELKLPLAEIPVKKAKLLMLKADCDGFMNLFVTGKLIAKRFKVIKSIALFGVTEICDNAFKGCKSLASVVIPPGVTEIGEGAFYGCKSLTSVVIPEGVTAIGNWAFYDCKSLSSVVIPPGVTEIGEEAFMGCNINELSHPLLAIKDGLVVKGSKVLYCASQSGSVTIPDGVMEIGRMAFRNCTSLTSVVIPEGVTEIGASAFFACKSLTSVVIPPGVTEIGFEAFCGCKSLTSVVIPEGVTEIGTSAFRSCESLKSVVIPEGVTEICERAFRDCTSLMSVVIPSSVTEIGEEAFCGCTSLASVEIPSSVTEIDGGAFFGCTLLSSVEIPSSVTVIVAGTFEGCTSLKSLEIPSSVTVIDVGAFKDCTSLEMIEFGGTVAQWKSVEKNSGWHDGVPATSVKCSDGEAEL